MKLYVLSAGEYDEWKIVNVFSSIEKLENFKKKFPEYNYNDSYEYFELDDNPKVYKTKDVYWVLFNEENILDCKKVAKIYDNIKCVNVICKSGDNHVVIYVWASTKEEAIKRARKIIEKGDK